MEDGRHPNDRLFSVSSGGPTGDWQLDIDRPPLGSLVGMLFRALVDRLGYNVSEHGGQVFRPSLLYILRSLYPTGISVTELAERCEITKQAVSQLLDQLERMELATRTTDPGDRRTKIVSLTHAGEQALADAVRAWGDVEKEWAELLGGPDVMHEVRQAMCAFIEAYGDWHPGEQPRLRPVW